MAEMVDYYEELHLDRGLGLEDLQQELNRLEKIWKQREIHSPEKAAKMQALIYEARAVFKTEASRRQYDRELEAGKRKPGEENPAEERARTREQWRVTAWEYFNAGQYDLAKTAIDNALMHADASDVKNDVLFSMAAEIYEKVGEYRAALDFINKAIVANPEDAMYSVLKSVIYDGQREWLEKNQRPYSDIVECLEKQRQELRTALDKAEKYGTDKLKGIILGMYAFTLYFDIRPDQAQAEQLALEAARLGDTTYAPQILAEREKRRAVWRAAKERREQAERDAAASRRRWDMEQAQAEQEAIAARQQWERDQENARKAEICDYAWKRVQGCKDIAVIEEVIRDLSKISGWKNPKGSQNVDEDIAFYRRKIEDLKAKQEKRKTAAATLAGIAAVIACILLFSSVLNHRGEKETAVTTAASDLETASSQGREAATTSASDLETASGQRTEAAAGSGEENSPVQGSCGEQVEWFFDEGTGTLTISGTGEMADCEQDEETLEDTMPWINRRKEIISLVIEEGVTSIGNEAFCECENLTDVTIPSSVERIGCYAFADCWKLSEVKLPENLKRLEEGIFDGTGIKEIGIPASVEIIEQGALAGMKLERISLNQDNQAYCIIDGVLFNKDQTVLWGYPAAKSDAYYAVPDGVTEIGSEAFYGSQNLTEIVLPESVTVIGDGAFRRCSSLTEMVIPNQVAKIGISAFYGCESLSKINIPAALTRMENNVFGRSGFTEFVIPPQVKEIGNKVFTSSDKLISIAVSEGVESIEARAFSGCEVLKEVTLPSTLTSIEKGIFNGNDRNVSLINYNGTKAQWDQLTEGKRYKGRRDVTLRCTDGEFEIPLP